MQRRMHKPGFTLIELLLVMMIIAVTAAIVAPSMSGFSRGRRLPNTATSLVTVARWCRVQALTDGVPYRLVIDRGNRLWTVMKDDGTGTGVYVQVEGDLGKATTLPEGIEFGDMTFQSDFRADETGDFVTFAPGGRTDVVTIPLTSDSGANVSIACDMPLGTFHIVKTVMP